MYIGIGTIVLIIIIVLVILMLRRLCPGYGQLGIWGLLPGQFGYVAFGSFHHIMCSFPAATAAPARTRRRRAAHHGRCA
jgi:hypothetical protein